jgi:hypothetical protein
MWLSTLVYASGYSKANSRAGDCTGRLYSLPAEFDDILPAANWLCDNELRLARGARQRAWRRTGRPGEPGNFHRILRAAA